MGYYFGATRPYGFLYRSDGTFTTINVPGSLSTAAFGINNYGDIVGSFTDNSGQHGFLDRDGVFTTLNAPLPLSASAINDSGQIILTGTGSYLATPVTVPEPRSLALVFIALAGFAGLIRARI
ncbi:MAG TPA: PEP-CTERM sorting domain-containing protein [Bryobacteraceae bacterium]|nr:PEP-CTERM sorting domain-containing protein [Bryobacteraceae bacterium]